MDSVHAYGTTQTALRSRTSGRLATTHELCNLLGLFRHAIGEHYAGARVNAGTRLGLFSRAGVAELLTQWSGRTVAYPSNPLLTVRQASEVLADEGIAVEPGRLAWRYLNCNLTLPAPLAVRVTPPFTVEWPDGRRIQRRGVLRFREDDLIAFAEEYDR